MPMPDREYLLLGALCIVALIGWVWWLIARRKKQDARQSTVWRFLLTLLFLLTVGGYLYYNLTFVQHQGRYLFPALIPIGLAFSIGWCQILGSAQEPDRDGCSRDRRAIGRPWLDEAQLIIFALIFIYLARLDLVALQRYIVPNLSAVTPRTLDVYALIADPLTPSCALDYASLASHSPHSASRRCAAPRRACPVCRPACNTTRSFTATMR